MLTATFLPNSPRGVRTTRWGPRCHDWRVPGPGEHRPRLLRKFVDTLPGLGKAAANSLGQYIPVAVPKKWIDGPAAA